MDENKKKKYSEIYPDPLEADAAHQDIMDLNASLALREQSSIVFNGLPYTTAYEYNRRKAINYSPPRNPKDDREVTFGIPHEKIIAFSALFLKYAMKRRVKCRDENGAVVDGIGTIYDLAIEHSLRLENFKKLLGLAYWEMFTQGNAFIFDDWEVMNRSAMVPMKDGQAVTPDQMDYSFEFLDGLTYEKGQDYQTRRAVSRLLDGRSVIFGNPEIEELQDQGTIWLEFDMSRDDMEAMFGSLSMWQHVPKDLTTINTFTPDKTSLFNVDRLAKPDSRGLVHFKFAKGSNKYNVYCNGIKMLPRMTPFTLFYPRNNYPLSNLPAERLTGSIYSRGIPAKTKFNADFIDWALKMLAYKFEQGVDPALLVKGRYTVTKDLFRGGQRTHGIKKDDYEKADPDNKGVTNNEVSFVGMLKEIIESQTVNATTSGELSANATATEIATLDQNQRDKLGYLLDGIVNGFTDIYQRRAETIESKYTIKQKETIVDGKSVNVYQNFSVNVSGIEHSVIFNDEIGQDGYDTKSKDYELFKKSFDSKKQGKPTEFHLVDPRLLREGRYTLDIEVFPEKVKDSALQMQVMWQEFTELKNVFGPQVNDEELKKIYLETSNRSDSIFRSPEEAKVMMELDAAGQQQQGQSAAGGVPNAKLSQKARAHAVGTAR